MDEILKTNSYYRLITYRTYNMSDIIIITEQAEEYADAWFSWD